MALASKKELIEKGADALLRAFFSRPVEQQHISVTSMDHYDLVLAVIAAIQEPTQEMIDAAEASRDNYPPDMTWEMMICAVSGNKTSWEK